MSAQNHEKFEESEILYHNPHITLKRYTRHYPGFNTHGIELCVKVDEPKSDLGWWGICRSVEYIPEFNKVVMTIYPFGDLRIIPGRACPTWYDTNYDYCRKVEIDLSKVSDRNALLVMFNSVMNLRTFNELLRTIEEMNLNTEDMD